LTSHRVTEYALDEIHVTDPNLDYKKIAEGSDVENGLKRRLSIEKSFRQS